MVNDERLPKKMDREIEEILKRKITDYRKTGDGAAKEAVMKIVKEYGDGADIRRIIRELK